MKKLKKMKDFLLQVLKEIWAFLKKSFWTVVHNPEAVITLILAGIGLAYLIGEMATKMKCPQWLEQTAVAETISGVVMLALVALMQRRDSCEARSV